jgi:hypothetical protein
MKRHLPQLFAVLLLALAFGYEQPESARAATKPLFLIMSTTTPVKDISLATLRRAFQGEPTEYMSGKRLIPINHLVNTPPRAQFDIAVLGLRGDEVGRFWIDRRIRDQSGPPKTVPSPDLAVRLVMSLPGAITYTTQELVGPRVQVLTVDGKSPGQEGYLLE